MDYEGRHTAQGSGLILTSRGTITCSKFTVQECWTPIKTAAGKEREKKKIQREIDNIKANYQREVERKSNAFFHFLFLFPQPLPDEGAMSANNRN